MPRVRVGDIEMFYVEAGAGDPVVLIMGFGGDHTAWAFQLRPFAERYRVIAFDNRGAGQTDQPDTPCTIALMADDTVGLLDRLGVERAHIVGVSMGGMIAPELALRAPPRFARELAKRMPGAELRLAPGAGHGYMWERPDAFNAICLDFLARVG